MQSSEQTWDKNPIYTVVQDPKDADACGWGFYDYDLDKIEKIYFKFPALGDDELRINITYAGLCHTECHIVHGDWWKRKNAPIIPGHEIIGDVTHVGKNVKDFQIGDKVGFGVFRDYCGNCRRCKRGDDHRCETVDHILTYGEKYWGGYATHLQQPAKLFFHIPKELKELPEEHLAPLMCAGITTFNPVAKHCKPGQNVAVLGIGGLGHMCIKYAKAWGCNVTAFTQSKDKIDLIKKLGADKVVVTTDLDAFKKEAKQHDVVLNNIPVMDQKMTAILSP